jgi:aspartate beta-hydroxylase
MTTARDSAQSFFNAAQQARALGNLTGALQLVRLALQALPEAPRIRLELGQILEAQGQTDDATRAYYQAVMQARARGLWLDDASVPDALYPQVLHAMEFVQTYRNGILLGLLQPLEQLHGADALQRIRYALEIYLGQREQSPAAAAQRPLFLYVPGLREQPYYQSDEFSWVPQAMAAQAEIMREAQAVLGTGALEPFLQGTDLTNYLRTDSGGPAKWDAYFFYRHGEAYPAHLQACPATAALLPQMPRVDIDEHAPEICFSVLAPGSHILPHTGVTNSRLVAHLPLILPPDCALQVVGHIKPWHMDEVLIFDDTFEHEAWNRSDQVRVILLMDVWHPDLSAIERSALRAVVEGIGRFNRG